jgi:hypothetical protein
MIVVAAALVALAGGGASAQLPDLKQLIRAPSSTASVSGERAAAGLKEALQIGTANAVSLTGKTDGYYMNEAIRIAMPEKLRMVEKGLRAVGQGPKVDEFVLSMNRAAERAAPAAKDIFMGAVRDMSFEDARGILAGGETAATDYFRARTSDRLRASFRPVVEKSMGESGVTKHYDEMVGRYKSIPFASGISFDVNDYVVDAALAGLFHMIAQQEKEIRTNPAARVTDLLQGVFGRG